MPPMSAEGRISGIFISQVPTEVEKPMGGYPIVQLDSANLIAGVGIESPDGKIKDRYAESRGAYSKVRPEVRQLSLITQDAIERANLNREIPFTWAETRRNIVISDMSAEELNSLLDKFIALGGVNVKGIELCSPCDRPDKLSGKKGFKLGFTNEKGESIGGLRVNILNSGKINVGDRVV